MIVSFFNDNTFVTGVDYKDKDECIAIVDLDEETQVFDLTQGKDFELLEIQEDKTCKINIFEGEKWKAKQDQIAKELAEQEKQRILERKTQILDELGSLKNQKDGLVLVGEDTKEIDAKMLELQTEYKNLIAKK